MEQVLEQFTETTTDIPELCRVEHAPIVARVSLSSDNGDFDEQESILLIEKRSFRPFKSAEDYLYAMREDLAEWLNGLYDLNINVDNFFEMLENGVILCEHANNVKTAADDFLHKNLTIGKKFSMRYEIPSYEVHFKRDSAPGSFFARDNVHNFIRWCRDLGVHDVLMFETDDLVLRKNEKHVILALLEIARRGARFGMAAPLLVQMEEDIDREIEKDRLAFEENERRVLIGQEEDDMLWDEEPQLEDTEPPNLIYGPQPQVITNDLLSLDEMVRDLVERCTCGIQFPMIKVSEGKYRIGDTKVLIFVRILRNHVMVRVGGGWDTLHHYLDKHDPCRCKSGHRSTISAKLAMKEQYGDRHLSSVTYERSSDGYTLSPGPRRKLRVQRNSLDSVSSLRHRSHSPAFRREPSPNVSSRTSSQNHSKEQACNGTNDAHSESNNELSPRKMSFHKVNSLESRDASNSMQREDSYLSRKNVIPPSPSNLKNSSSSVRNGSSNKSKSPSCENLTKKNRYKNSADYGKKLWNAGPGLRSDIMRKNSVDHFDGKISRSNSSISDGGFEFMLQKENSIRQSARLGNNRVHAPMKSSKPAWNGRGQHNYSTLGSETVRPPKVVTRSARSASASPATTRKNFTSSAPSTPATGSPKRSPNLNPGNLAPILPPDILSELPNVNGDRDAEILAQLEGFVNNYRAYVLDKLASEGRSLPPDLAETEKENESSDKNQKYGSLKATPRKAGVGSRIPAPVF